MNDVKPHQFSISKWKKEKIDDAIKVYTRMKFMVSKESALENYRELKNRMEYLKDESMSFVKMIISRTKDMKPFLLAYYDFPEEAPRSDDWFKLDMYHYFRGATKEEIAESKKIERVPKDIMEKLKIFDPEEISVFLGEPIRIEYGMYECRSPVSIIDLDWEIRKQKEVIIEDDIEEQIAILSTYDDKSSLDEGDLPF